MFCVCKIKKFCLYSHTRPVVGYCSHFIPEFAEARTSLIEAVSQVVGTLLTPARLIIFPTALSADVCYKHVGVLPAEEGPNRSVLSKSGGSGQGVWGALCSPPPPRCSSAPPLTFSSFHKGGLPCFSLNGFNFIYWTKVNNTEERQPPSWRKMGNVFHSGCTILYPTSNSIFSTSSQTFQSSFSLLNNSHPGGYKMLSHCFTLHFPIDDVEYFFMFFLAICNHFWRNTYLCPLLIFNWVICCWVVGVSYILWILSPYHIHDLQGFIFSHSIGHIFTSDDKCSDGTKVLILLKFSLSCCCCSRFWCHG